MTNIRDQAKEHWKYTGGVVARALNKGNPLSAEEIMTLCQYLYIEAMVHGYKHAKEETP